MAKYLVRRAIKIPKNVPLFPPYFLIVFCGVERVADKGIDALALSVISAKLPRLYCTNPSDAIIVALSVQ